MIIMHLLNSQYKAYKNDKSNFIFKRIQFLKTSNIEPNKLSVFVNYALKMPEYECQSNFSCITYSCLFSAYTRCFDLFRIYEFAPGD